MISNSKIYIWKSLSPPIKVVVLYLLIFSYTKLNYFQDELKYMHAYAHTRTNTHLSKCNQHLLKGYDVPGLQLPGIVIAWGSRKPNIYSITGLQL